jgi:hypothetical protein
METLQNCRETGPAAVARRFRHSVRRVSGLAVTVLVAALILASCASVPRPLKPETTTAIANDINSGSVDRLVAMSSKPFAFDAEVFDRTEDISTLWGGLVSAGMKVDVAALAPAGTRTMDGKSVDEPVTSDSYKQFSDSTITNWFFQRHVPPRSRLLRLESNLGPFLVVASDTGKQGPVIYGLAGPLK